MLFDGPSNLWCDEIRYLDMFKSPFYTKSNDDSFEISGPATLNAELNAGCPLPTNRINMSPLLYALSPVLKDLQVAAQNCRRSWYREVIRLQKEGFFESQYLLASHSFTFGIVGDFLEILSKNKTLATSTSLNICRGKWRRR